MANIKQKIIRIKTNEKSRLRNKALKSRVRTFIKKTKKAIINKDADVTTLINQTNKEIDKAVSKGVWKEGKASRTKSRLMKFYNKINGITPKAKKEVKKPAKTEVKKPAVKKTTTAKKAAVKNPVAKKTTTAKKATK